MSDAKFWLFKGEDYYPDGGVWDFLDYFDTLDDAKATVETYEMDSIQWVNVIEVRQNKIVNFWTYHGSDKEWIKRDTPHV